MFNISTTSDAPSFYFNNYSIESSYSFSEYSSTSRSAKSGKVWLNMVFMHPTKKEAVTVRTAKSLKLLSQPKEVIEAIAQRDIRNYLTFSMTF